MGFSFGFFEKEERKREMLASSLRRAVLVSVRSNAAASSAAMRWSSNDNVKFDSEGKVVGSQYDVGVPDLEHTEFLIPSPGLLCFCFFCFFSSLFLVLDSFLTLFLLFFSCFNRKPWSPSWYVPSQERL